MNRKPSTLPLHWVTRSAAALAEPPVIVALAVCWVSFESSMLTSSNDVVHNKDVLSLGNSIFLHLEEVLAVFLDVLGSYAGARQLALLADSGEANTKAEGKAGAKQEASCVETDNDIGFGAGERLGNLQDQGID